ncbi:hypothetical protein [Parvularcula maris]|uniref:Uncharacterized protein n=1 Tax=Parvularcula maris TaxID=2965077 RepID=A0A9X2RJ46_9PROT|nr:hypothetical protein [Parvularcula maris]MCQ8185536.1 hypothetical protein [Parvularcula maris]
MAAYLIGLLAFCVLSFFVAPLLLGLFGDFEPSPVTSPLQQADGTIPFGAAWDRKSPLILGVVFAFFSGLMTLSDTSVYQSAFERSVFTGSTFLFGYGIQFFFVNTKWSAAYCDRYISFRDRRGKHQVKWAEVVKISNTQSSGITVITNRGRIGQIAERKNYQHFLITARRKGVDMDDELTFQADEWIRVIDTGG